MELKTRDLLLRTVTYDDINEVARTWEFQKGGITKEAAKKAIDWMRETRNKNHLHHLNHICFAVFETSKDEIIGWCGLDGGIGTNRDNGKIEIFYIIDDMYRGKGFATQCGKKLLEYGFMQLSVPRIYGGCSAENIASKRVLEKIGMKHMTIRENSKPKFYLTLDEYRE